MVGGTDGKDLNSEEINLANEQQSDPNERIAAVIEHVDFLSSSMVWDRVGWLGWLGWIQMSGGRPAKYEWTCSGSRVCW